MLHSARRHSGGPVGSVPLIILVIRSRIGLNNRHMICEQYLEIGIWNQIDS